MQLRHGSCRREALLRARRRGTVVARTLRDGAVLRGRRRDAGGVASLIRRALSSPCVSRRDRQIQVRIPLGLI